jgi:Raf kinase inhibitor-like YbhB/YbcL family protein
MSTTMAFRLTSPAFSDGGDIPVRHTCDGSDVSPALTWVEVPEGTRSFALIVDDPDATAGDFTHWVTYDLSSELRELGEGAAPVTQGRNSFGRTGYGGPCPPPADGAHRYRFTLYALDLPQLALAHGTREELQAQMEGHVVATAQLVGRYRRHPASMRQNKI